MTDKSLIDFSSVGVVLRRQFFQISAFVFAITAIISILYPPILWTLFFTLPIFALGLQNAFQKKRAILRNFPVLGALRYFFEMIRPEIQQYFVESETDGTPIPRETRSVVYQRAKLATDTLPFGTQMNVYQSGYEWISHTLVPTHTEAKNLRVKIGGPDCRQPYEASVFNISAMSFGALSDSAILALNGGAKLGGFYHNTGEGGVSPYHLKEGGDLVWQIGTGYFGCRHPDGRFSEELFQQQSQHPNIKMIEVKLSQGAKPAHGGILPAAKITPEIMEIRKVQAGVDVVSPPAHSAFSNPIEFMNFLKNLRELSGGKPVGFKMCFGRLTEFISVCKAMIETGIYPDFITVDGGEGGTGAAPLEFSNNVGAPLEEGLTQIHNVLVGFGIRERIKIIASGKVMTGFNLLSRLALGADLCNSARGMMLALGCIQARKCNTNHCPTGVATSNRELIDGLVPEDKRVRVFQFHKQTVHALAEIMGAMGLRRTDQIDRRFVHRRVSGTEVKTYSELFPEVTYGSFLNSIPDPRYALALEISRADSFIAVQNQKISKAS